MNWFRADFGGLDEAVQMLKDYDIIPENTDPAVEFKEYDWTLELVITRIFKIRRTDFNEALQTLLVLIVSFYGINFSLYSVPWYRPYINLE